jgi:AcrR family transcriptional regulator
MNVAARPYRQSARAESVAATGRRILDVFFARLHSGWMDEITLEEIARDAGVSVQTVIRRFGGKEGLLRAAAERLGEEVTARRDIPADGDPRAHVAAVFDDYEVSGSLVLRLLAQEDRWPALKPWLKVGRAKHRETVERHYRHQLERLLPEVRERLIVGLVAVTDVFTWRLLRLDQGLGRDAAVELAQSLAAALLESAK